MLRYPPCDCQARRIKKHSLRKLRDAALFKIGGGMTLERINGGPSLHAESLNHGLRKCLFSAWFAAVVIAWSPGAEAQERPWREINEAHSARPFLRWERPAYTNFSRQNFTNYTNHSHPYEDSPQAFYGSMGNHLITGYPLYEWTEVRTPGTAWTSTIFKFELGVASLIFRSSLLLMKVTFSPVKVAVSPNCSSRSIRS